MAVNFFHGILSFWKKQRKNWRVAVTQMMFSRFFNNLTLDYADIYVRELGADPVQLGIVNSLAGIGNTILAIPVGWMHDKYSLRKLFLFGRVLLVFSSLFYALAFD